MLVANSQFQSHSFRVLLDLPLKLNACIVKLLNKLSLWFGEIMGIKRPGRISHEWARREAQKRTWTLNPLRHTQNYRQDVLST
jgi:hypothetical protein